MYLPAQFGETRIEELHRLISAHPLGVLVVHGPAGLDANHLPFEFVAQPGGQGSLIAHVARENTVLKEKSDGAGVRVRVRGDHGAVSPDGSPVSTHNQSRRPPGPSPAGATAAPPWAAGRTGEKLPPTGTGSATGRGRSFRVALVITPSVPSEPTNRLVKS